jgi:hypothetical protein
VADRLIWRRYYARGKRHDHESYGAVCDPHHDNRGLAYHRVQGNREGLVYRADPSAVEVMVTQGAYVLSPMFSGGYLIWVELKRKHWIIRALSTVNVATGRITEPISCSGRPIHLNSDTKGDSTVLVWEERIGKRTRIRGCLIHAGQFGQPVDMTAGVFNAYDPQCLVLRDGRVALTYSAFVDGHYHVYVQFFSDTLYPEAHPTRVSDGPGAALYPSICERREGGLWFSFAKPSQQGLESHVVTHRRHRAQSELYSGQLTLAVGALHNDRLWAPFATPEDAEGQGQFTAMTVFGAESGGHSRVFEDSDGRLRLLFRQHADRARVAYEDDDRVLMRSRTKGAVQGAHCYASTCLMTLMDRQWSTPVVLISNAHVQAPISCCLSGDTLRVAFTEDGRHTGRDAVGEWMDRESEVSVGAVELGLSLMGIPQYDLRPYGISEMSPEGVVDPVRECSPSGEYYVAMGQTHAHSEISVCQRSFDRDADFKYRFFQDVQHCDFGSITDHAYNMWQTEMLLMRKLADYYYFPDEFVAIQGYEWTGSSRICVQNGGPWGHVAPLMFDESSDIELDFAGDQQCEGRSLARLAMRFKDASVIAPPLHMVDTLYPFRWDAFDETLMPVVELFDDLHGSCEAPLAPGVSHSTHIEQGPWCDTELLAGKHFGFIAGGDHGGLARSGILTRALTREALYEALMARRSFATTGVGLHIEFCCGGDPMGSVVDSLESDFHLVVEAPEHIHSIHVVHNGQTESKLEVGASSFQHDWTVKRRRHGEFWYCRILMANGELAWTSPIWIG